MVDPSPLVQDLTARLASIEARLSILDAEIAEREQERDRLRDSLEGVKRALDPEQVSLPLPGLGEALKEPRRRLTAKGEELLREAIAIHPKPYQIPRTSQYRGDLKAARHLATGNNPMLKEVELTYDVVRYAVTAEGELVARALPAKEGT